MSDINDYTNQIHTGDAFDVLPELPDDSIHACVTDPPYGLAFMGRDWDDFEPKEYQEWCERWAREVKRVLKPGGHLLAFSGNRTHHRLFTGVEDAGFEIRDTITWHYGGGFPKASDISKAIDRRAGDSGPELAAVLKAARADADLSRDEVAERVGCTASSIRDWEEGRRRSADDDGVEWVIPSDEYRDKLADAIPAYPTAAEGDVVGYYQENGERDGVFDDDASGFGSGERTDTATDAAKKWDGFKTGLKPATEYVVVARKPFDGATVDCVLEHGTGALNIDLTRIESDGRKKIESHAKESVNDYGDGLNGSESAGTTTEGRYPSNVVFDETEAERLDREVGECPSDGIDFSKTVDNQNRDKYGEYTGERTQSYEYDDDHDGPSRYFYTSKASKAERTLDGAIDNAHPTVKPADLMEWLITLVTAEGQTVLDPFAGSGTTLRAAKDKGRRFVGIEKQAKWADVARVRAGLTPDDPSTVRADGVTGLDAFTDGGAE